MKKNILLVVILLFSNIIIPQIYAQDFITNSISGTIKDNLNQPIPNVTVIVGIVGDTTTYTTQTDASGNYAFNVSSGLNYIITPHKINYEFTPLSDTVINITTDIIKNFTGESTIVTISGTIKDSLNQPIPYVKLIISGSIIDTISTDINGYYSFNVQKNSSFIITPHKEDYTFEPRYQTFTKVNKDTTANFLAIKYLFKLTIKIFSKIDSTPIKDINIIIMVGSYIDTVKTNSNGIVQVKLQNHIEYLIEPIDTNYIFEPTNNYVTINNNDVEITFYGNNSRIKIYGNITDSITNSPIENVMVMLKETAIDTIYTDQDGYYEFLAFKYGNYILTPIKQGREFNPQYIVLNSISQDTIVNFKSKMSVPILISPNGDAVSPNPRFSWIYNGTGDSIIFRLKLYNNNDSIYIDNIKDTTTTITGLSQGISYYWTVCAIAGNDTSDWATPLMFNTKIIKDTVSIAPLVDTQKIEDKNILLLIHGLNTSERAATPSTHQWDNFLDFYYNDSDLQDAFIIYTVNYYSNLISTEEIANILKNKIEKMDSMDSTFASKELFIIGYDLGGVITKSFMENQIFSTGKWADQKCGSRVKLLITLGAPIHGTPLGNGPARDDKIDSTRQEAIKLLDQALFYDIRYNDYNRVDLHWDNSDNLLDYNKFSEERNIFLEQLNANNSFDNKIIAYFGKIDGSYNPPPYSENNIIYNTFAYILKEDMGMESDGLVPNIVASHNFKKTRVFDNYNHDEIVNGKTSDSSLLFVNIKQDLFSMAYLIIFSPKNRIALNLNTNLEITWSAPDDISKINIAYSLDNNKTFHEIANDIDASLNQYTWEVPDTNADSCYIKIWSDDNNVAYNKIPFNIFHNRIIINEPKKDTIWSHGETDTIKWEYTGLIDSVKIDYIDNDTNRKITINQTSIANKTQIWEIPANTPLSYHSTIKSSIIKLQNGYIYPEDYQKEFTSDTFNLYPEKNIQIISPDSNNIDLEGISGQYLFIDSNVTIKWNSQGNIKNFNIYLINKETNETKTIVTDFSVTLKHYLNNEYIWKVQQDTPGDNFILKIEDASNPSIFDTTNYTFRIRKNGPEILNPKQNSEDIPLYPSFTWRKLEGASSYKIAIYDCQTKKLVFSQEDIKDTTFKIPENPKNELKINTEYYFTIKAFYNSSFNNLAKKKPLMLSNSTYTFNSKIKFKTENKAPEDNLTLLKPENNAEHLLSSITFQWTRPKGTEKFHFYIIYRGSIYLKYSKENLSEIDTVLTVNFDQAFPDTVYWKVVAQNSAGTISRESHFLMESPVKKIGNLIYTCYKWDDYTDDTYKGTGKISIKKQFSSDSIVVKNGYIITDRNYSKLIEGYGTVIYYVNNTPKEIFKGTFKASDFSIIPYVYNIINHLGLPSKNQLINKINLSSYDIHINYSHSKLYLPHHGFYTIAWRKENALYFTLNGDIIVKKNGSFESNFKNNLIEIAQFKFNLSKITLKGNINYSWIQSNKVKLNVTKNSFFRIDVPMYYKNPMIFTIDGKKAGFAKIKNNTVNTNIETLFPSIKLGYCRFGQPYIQFVYLQNEKIWALDGFALFSLPFRMITPPKGKFMGRASKFRYPVIFASFKAYNEPPYIRSAELHLYDANIMVTPVVWFNSFNAVFNMTANSQGQLRKLYFKGQVGFGLGASYWSFIISGTPGIKYNYTSTYRTKKVELFGEVKALFGLITIGEARLSFENKSYSIKLLNKKARITQSTLKGIGRVAFPNYNAPWIDVGIKIGLRVTKYSIYNSNYFKYDSYLAGYGKIGVPKHSIKKFGIRWPRHNIKIANARIEMGKFKTGNKTLLGAQAGVALGTFKYKKCKCSGKWWKPKSWKCHCYTKKIKIKARAFVNFKTKKLSVGTNFYKLKEFRRSVALRRLKALSYMKNYGKLSKLSKSYYNYVKNFYYSEEGDSIFFNIPKTNKEQILITIKQYSNKRPKVVLCSPSDTLYYSEDIITNSPDVIGDSGYIMAVNAEPGQWKAFVFDIDSQDDYELIMLDENSPPELTINAINIENDSILKIDYTALDKDDTANIQFFMTENDTIVGTQINIDAIEENDGRNIYNWNYKNVTTGNYYIYGIINDGANSSIVTKLWGPYYLNPKTKILPPENIVITKQGDLINIQWDSQDAMNTYDNLYIGLSSENLSDTITNIYNNYYLFKPETDTTTYYFRLKSIDENNNESDLSDLYSFKADTITIDTIPPDKPNPPEVEVFLSDSSDSYIKIKWNKVDNSNGYIIYVKNSELDSSLQYIDVGDTDSSTLIGLEEGFSYDIAIIAYDIFNNRSEPSLPTKINYYNMEDTDNDDMIDDKEIQYFGSTDITDDKYGDVDDDGLSNIYEMDTLFTNPNNNDTDGDKVWDDVDPNPLQYRDSDNDNMPDDWEIFNNAKEPYKDLDFDGLTNVDEFNFSTDPRNKDTDGGGRADGDEVARGLNPTNKLDDYSDKKIEIQVTDFSGIRVNDKIVISWNGKDDYTIKGYELLKYTSTDSMWFTINPDLIEIPDDSSDIHYYEYIDSLGIDSTVSYKYKLIAIGYYNNTDTMGVIDIKAPQTTIEEHNNLLLKKVKLYQNYPNPFNAGTIITYEIPKGNLENDVVTLSIYNMLGQKIEELVNETKSYGRYTVHWYGKDKNGKKLESGIYIYQLRIGNYIIKKKMTLIK